MATKTTTRAEHMSWCKRRALAYLPDDPQGALASMMLDLSKHPGTDDPAMARLTMMQMLDGHLSSADQVRRHIDGFD